MRKFTKKEIKKLKKYWKELDRLQYDFDFVVRVLENKMQNELKIEDLEFFMCDGCYCGIGTMTRTIKLIQGDELEKK